METQNSGCSADIWCSCRSRRSSISGPLISIFAFFLLLAGCASPGEPIERKAPVPEPVKDLAAAQSGNDVILTFTLPTEALDHRQLVQTPTVEIYRDFPPTATTGTPVSPARLQGPALLVTIPPSLVDKYASNGSVRYPDSLTADDFAQHPDGGVEYMVRARESERKSSPDSNLAELRIYPAPLPIDDVKTVFTRSAVDLAWTPPQKTPAGASPAIATYRIYRAEVESETGGAPGSGAAATGENLKLKSPLVRIGESDSPAFSDAQAVLDTPYVYTVRSVVQYSGAAIESSDSNFAVITPRDLLPPAAPQGLLVVPVPAQGDTPAHLELSWAISPEPDIAGYYVYRNDSQGTRGARQNQDLLLTPAFRDISVQPGKHYFYTVTAVDRSGNESAASEAVSGDMPAQN
jgi:hypothetical protein